MTRTSREALVSMMADIHRGRINRREFLERTIALGVSSGAAMALLEACGGSSGGSSSGPLP
jgi:multiple sugar transport system substrate-binding protein